MNRSYAEAKLEDARRRLALLEETYNSLLTSGAQSYKMQDGQTSREVTNVNLTSVYNQLLATRHEVDVWESRVEGFSSVAFRVGQK